MDNIIETSAARIFTDNTDNPAALWTALEECELTRAWIPQSMEGAGLSLSDVFGLIRLSSTTIRSVPFAETLLASHLLSLAGLQTPTGAISIAVNLEPVHYDTAYDNPGNKGGNTEGNTEGNTGSIEIPFGDTAEYVVAMTNATAVSLFKTYGAELINSVGSDPLYKLSLQDLTAVSTATLQDGLTMDTINQTCALVRSAQMCGAMDAILDLTLAHTSSREQFGRPLAKFQAIQHLLAEIAGEAAASSAIVEAAVASFKQGNRPDLRTTASAKARTSEAAGLVAANAHQAHGAIGYTQEYALSAYTRRLWRWREEFGNETHWALALGKDYLRADAGTLTEEFF